MTCDGKVATIVGTEGDDVLHGTPGNDVINSLGGNDTVDGGGGNDTSCGGAGDDTVSGGPGDDVIDGGPGVDLVSYSSAPKGVKVDLGRSLRRLSTIGGFATGGAGNDVLTGIEAITGSAFNDSLAGDAENNAFFAGAGNDVVNGRGGNDRAEGGPGLDRLAGGRGNDVLYGGAGRDQLSGGAGSDGLVGGLGADLLNGGLGRDDCDPGGGGGREVSCETTASPGGKTYSDTFTTPGQSRTHPFKVPAGAESLVIFVTWTAPGALFDVRVTNAAGKPIGRRSPAAVLKRAPRVRVTRGATYVKVKVVRAGQNKRLRIVVKARKVTAPTRVQTHVVVHKAPKRGKERRKG